MSKVELNNEELVSKPSIVWKYYGFKEIDGKIVNRSHVYCIPCFKASTADNLVFKQYGISTSTTSMRCHLESFHKLKLDKKNKHGTEDSLQSKMTEYLSNIDKSDSNQEKLRETVNKRNLKPTKAGIMLCCKELLNLEVIYGENFRLFLNEVGINHKGNIDTNKQTVIEEFNKLYQHEEELRIEKVATVKQTNLGMYDICPQKDEHLFVLTTTFITEDWKIEKFTISTFLKEWEEENVVPNAWIKSVVNNYDMGKKNVTFVSSNKITVGSLKNITNFPCIGDQTASLLHKQFDEDESLKKLYETISNIYSVMYYSKERLPEKYMTSILRTAYIITSSAQICLFPNSETENFVPAWHIQYHVFKMFNESKDTILEVLENDLVQKSNMFLNSEDLNLVELYINIYHIFFTSIKGMYADGEPFISNKIVFKHYIIKLLTELAAKQTETYAKLICDIAEKVEKTIEISAIDLLASILDIRSKNMEIVKKQFRDKERTRKNILEYYLGIEKLNEEENDHANLSVRTLNANLFTSLSVEEEDLVSPNSEIDDFIEDQSKTVDLMSWWKKNELKYKRISKLAKIYSPILAITYPKNFYDIEFLEAIKKTSLLTQHKEKMFVMHFNS